MVNFEKCSAVTGFNTKQLWVYDSENDTYIDPPKDVLDEIDAKTKDSDVVDYSDKENLLDEVISTNPDWLQDKEYTYNADETDI